MLKALINALILTATALVSLCSDAADNISNQPALVGDIDRVHNAADQLVRSQLSSGLFPYDFDFTTGNETDMENIEGMNLVRQTGAAFALGEYLIHFDHEPAGRALKVFLKNTISSSLPISKGYTQKTLEGWGSITGGNSGILCVNLFIKWACCFRKKGMLNWYLPATIMSGHGQALQR